MAWVPESDTGLPEGQTALGPQSSGWSLSCHIRTQPLVTWVGSWPPQACRALLPPSRGDGWVHRPAGSPCHSAPPRPAAVETVMNGFSKSVLFHWWAVSYEPTCSTSDSAVLTFGRKAWSGIRTKHYSRRQQKPLAIFLPFFISPNMSKSKWKAPSSFQRTRLSACSFPHVWAYSEMWSESCLCFLGSRDRFVFFFYFILFYFLRIIKIKKKKKKVKKKDFVTV